MRPRNKKNLVKRLSAGAEVLEQDPESKKGAWKGDYKSLRVEIGCERLGFIGATVDAEANKVRGKEQIISGPDSKVTIMVVPTNEELAIARDTYALCK